MILVGDAGDLAAGKDDVRKVLQCNFVTGKGSGVESFAMTLDLDVLNMDRV